jgi:hypothetical protein
MKEVCPLSAEINHRIITDTNKMDVKETINRDFFLLENMMSSYDFKEGVRCLLIDKGSKPKWSASDVGSVDSQEVTKLMTPSK